MNDTATMMTTDLDRLAERVEKAAALVQQLKDDRVRLERERDELTRKVQDLESKLQGQGVMDQEIGTLKSAQREWAVEKAHSLMKPVLGASQSKKLIERVLMIETSSAREIAGLLRTKGEVRGAFSEWPTDTKM